MSRLPPGSCNIFFVDETDSLRPLGLNNDRQLVAFPRGTRPQKFTLDNVSERTFVLQINGTFVGPSGPGVGAIGRPYTWFFSPGQPLPPTAGFGIGYKVFADRGSWKVHDSAGDSEEPVTFDMRASTICFRRTID